MRRNLRFGGDAVASRCGVKRTLRIITFVGAAMLPAMPSPVRAEPRSIAYHVPLTLPGHAPVRLHVEEHGRGRPLILLHGMGGSGYSFRRIVGPLARTHRVITIDLKGFGASEKPFDLLYAPSDQAALIEDFMRQRRLTHVTLAGHSYGGAVALMTALRLQRTEPGRIRRLVLMNAPAYPQPLPRSQHLLSLPVLPHIGLAVVPPILNARAALRSTRAGAPPVDDRDAIAYAEPLYEPGGRHALIATARIMASYDGWDAIPYYRNLQIPTQLIWCRNDPTVPLSTGERLARTLPNARLSVLDGCDHAPAEEQPAETVAVMQRFLGRE
jgi:pimeloyl-ACP methyl ester carboxylesterase